MTAACYNMSFSVTVSSIAFIGLTLHGATSADLNSAFMRLFFTEADFLILIKIQAGKGMRAALTFVIAVMLVAC